MFCAQFSINVRVQILQKSEEIVENAAEKLWRITKNTQINRPDMQYGTSPTQTQETLVSGITTIVGEVLRGPYMTSIHPFIRLLLLLTEPFNVYALTLK